MRCRGWGNARSLTVVSTAVFEAGLGYTGVMSKVPEGYPNEQGKSGRCGDSWAGQITVTGALPGWSFGKDFAHTIKPIVSSVPLNAAQSEEAAGILRDKIQARINDVRDELDKNTPWLNEKEPISDAQRDAIVWLLDHAEAELSAAMLRFDKWRYRADGAFPLDLGDSLEAFSTLHDTKEKCTYGARVYTKYWDETGGRPLAVGCPTKSEMAKRQQDRDAIRQRFLDALRHVRCAEFGVWKLVLVADALAASGADDFGFAAEGAPKKKWQGKHMKRLKLRRLFPSPDNLPDPSDVPDDPEDDEEDEGVLEGEGGPLPEPPPPAPSKPSNTKALALGLGGLGLGLLLWKGMK